MLFYGKMCWIPIREANKPSLCCSPAAGVKLHLSGVRVDVPAHVTWERALVRQVLVKVQGQGQGIGRHMRQGGGRADIGTFFPVSYYSFLYLFFSYFFFCLPFFLTFPFRWMLGQGTCHFSLLSTPTFSQKLPVKTTDGARNNIVFEGS